MMVDIVLARRRAQQAGDFVENDDNAESIGEDSDSVISVVSSASSSSCDLDSEQDFADDVVVISSEFDFDTVVAERDPSGGGGVSAMEWRHDGLSRPGVPDG
eukprot:4096962-Karenia_brevis.AAC.1